MIRHAVVALALLCLLSGCGGAPATFTWRATITDAATGQPVAASIFVDDQQVATNVTQADVPVAADSQRHRLRVEATGYQAWQIEIAGETTQGRVVLGPVKLKKA
jgi:hypothetical protein